MKILVTGAAGFMGSHLFDYLQKKNHTVLGIDNYSIGSYANPYISKVDLLDAGAVSHFVQETRPEVIYHLASWAHEGLSQFAPIRITQNNYLAYLNLLVPAINAGVKRIVLVSSMAVYGRQKPPFSESMERKPVDVYGLAKTAMERVTEILAGVHGFEYVIIRPHNVYGPRQVMTDPYRNVVAIFINACLRNKLFYIYGDGKQERSFSYIDDVTPWLAEAGWHEKMKGEIFNVGPVQSFTINELADAVLENFRGYMLKPQHLPDRPVEVKRAYCANDKIEKTLGYMASTSLSEGIRKMCNWARYTYPLGIAPKYLDALEIEKNAPQTWKEQLI